MKALISILLILMLSDTGFPQNKRLPNLGDKAELKELRIGKIVQKDKSILKEIILIEIKEFGIIYEKKKGLHDLFIESIDYIEFPETKWGPLRIHFIDNKPIAYLI
ncbi:MAG: hypothetical protein WCO63_01715 [Bacteroidota bacterium]